MGKPPDGGNTWREEAKVSWRSLEGNISLNHLEECRYDLAEDLKLSALRRQPKGYEMIRRRKIMKRGVLGTFLLTNYHKKIV
ncbi:hypothetical protein HanPSC8_Chr03g0122911 [Helianthus annuus]|nr:hypothetical protein HanPSC8_Chr03g0122911 [Helianthus annuus]